MEQIRRGAVVRAVRGPKGDWTLTQQPEVEGAFVAMDPRNGAIKALVGGFDFNRFGRPKTLLLDNQIYEPAKGQ